MMSGASAHSPSSRLRVASSEDALPLSEMYRKQFLEAFDSLVKELTEDGSAANPEIAEGIEHLEEVLMYNVPGGKCNRGLMVIGSLQHLVAGRKLTADEEKKAIVLGWCVELLQAFFLVADDIMDQSKMRRGKPCWYLKDGVGLMAINDSLGIGLSVFRILRRHFRQESYYADLVDLFHEIAFHTEMGQTLDLLTATGEGSEDSEDELDFSQYTIERYHTIVKYKTGYYSFYLPVALAMHMAGISDEQAHIAAKNILLAMGEFFQIQDDFLDCYGDPDVTGKVGTDIEECKCSWLIIQALKKASTEQVKILKASYGRNDPDCVAKVKQVYQELDLEACFHGYEEESYQRLVGLIQEQCGPLPQQLFTEFADRIYKRKS